MGSENIKNFVGRVSFQLDYNAFWEWVKINEKYINNLQDENGLPAEKICELYHGFQAFYLAFIANGLETVTIRSVFYSWYQQINQSSNLIKTHYELMVIKNEFHAQSVLKKQEELYNSYVLPAATISKERFNKGLFNRSRCDLNPFASAERQVTNSFMVEACYGKN